MQQACLWQPGGMSPDKIWQLYIERGTRGGRWGCYFYLSFTQGQTTERWTAPHPPTFFLSDLSRRRSSWSGLSFSSLLEKLLEDGQKWGNQGRWPAWRNITWLRDKLCKETKTNRSTWLCCATTKAVASSLTQTRTWTVRSCLFLYLFSE